MSLLKTSGSLQLINLFKQAYLHDSKFNQEQILQLCLELEKQIYNSESTTPFDSDEHKSNLLLLLSNIEQFTSSVEQKESIKTVINDLRLVVEKAFPDKLTIDLEAFTPVTEQVSKFKDLVGLNVGKYIDSYYEKDTEGTLLPLPDQPRGKVVKTDRIVKYEEHIKSNEIVPLSGSEGITNQIRNFFLMEDVYTASWNNVRNPSNYTPTDADMRRGWKWRLRNQKLKAGIRSRITLDAIVRDLNHSDPNKRFYHFPNKSFTREEWGGTNEAIKANAHKFMRVLLQSVSDDIAKAPLERDYYIETVEIGNEPWGEPGIEAYHNITAGYINAFTEHFGTDDIEKWPINLAHAAFQNTFENNIFGDRTKAQSDYLPKMVDAKFTDVNGKIRHFSEFVKELNCHCYPFPKQEWGDRYDLRMDRAATPPEVTMNESMFALYKEIKDYANARDMKLSITEFGWNSGVDILEVDESENVLNVIRKEGVGGFAQAAYVLRSYLLFARFGIHKAYLYESVDNPGNGLFHSCGIATIQVDLNPEQGDPIKIGKQRFEKGKPIYTTLKDFMSIAAPLKVTHFIENDDYYLYLLGEEANKPTYAAIWRPIRISYEDDADTTSITMNLLGQQLKVGGMPVLMKLEVERNIKVDKEVDTQLDSLG